MFNELCTYDRKAKAYVLRPAGNTTEIYQFPSGPKGKMQAYQFWLSLEYPSIYNLAAQLAHTNPHAERTIWKAAEIAINPEMIDRIDDQDLIAMVQSTSDPYGRYLISSETADIQHQDEYLLCNCPAYQDMTPVYLIFNDEDGTMQICKHALAVWMQNQITQQPQPVSVA